MDEVELHNSESLGNGHRSLYALDVDSSASPSARHSAFSVAANGHEPTPLTDTRSSRSDAPEWTSASQPRSYAGSSKLDSSKCGQLSLCMCCGPVQAVRVRRLLSR